LVLRVLACLLTETCAYALISRAFPKRRSADLPFGEVDRVIGGAATFTAWAASYLYDRIRLVSIIGDDWPAPELQKMEARGIDLEDRKSTRLNSSHVSISYAVFCLNKKTAQ